ncbi:hypothetical protein STEG23_018368, partial [Scotinomys teguina]
EVTSNWSYLSNSERNLMKMEGQIPTETFNPFLSEFLPRLKSSVPGRLNLHFGHREEAEVQRAIFELAVTLWRVHGRVV